MPQQDHRILFLAMYPLDRADRGPQVRILNLYQAMEGLAPVDLLAGSRPDRRREIVAYLRSGRLAQIGGLYVENNTSWADATDLLLMRACHKRGIPVVTYIRDAHPFFPDTDWGGSKFKFAISAMLWRLSIRAYLKFSDALAFQTESFARLFTLPPGKRCLLLPPAANLFSPPRLTGDEVTLLYAGNGRTSRYGVDILVNAVDIARQTLPRLKLQVISTPEERPSPDLLANRPWIKLKHLSTDEIRAYLPQTRAVLIPFRTIPYHQLLIPIKLMDYLAYGRPMLVTRCREIARFVEENRLGFVVDDNPESMAVGIERLFAAPLDELNRMGQNALALVRDKHSWRHRGQLILDTFAEVRQSR